MSLLDTGAKGFPSLAGVVWGVMALGDGWSIIVNVECLIAGLFVGWLGRTIIGRAPLTGLFLIDLSIVATSAIVSISTWLVLLASMKAPTFFQTTSPDELKALTGALVGALTTYFAFVWTKDIADGTGPLWPSSQFRTAVRTAFSTGAHVPTAAGNRRVYDTVFADRVTTDRIEGWSYGARWKRAWILHDYLR
jgi:hypothetical protein